MAFECTEVSEVCPVKLTTLGYYPNKPLNIFCAVAFGLALIIQLVLGIWKKTYAFTGFVVAGCALEVAGTCLLLTFTTMWSPGIVPSEVNTSALLPQGVADGVVMRQLRNDAYTRSACYISTGQPKQDGARLTRHRIGYAARVPLNANPWNSQAFQTQICAIVLAPTLTCISIYLTLKHLTMSLNPSLSRLRPKLLPYIFVPADVSCLLVQAIGGALAASGGRTNRRLVDDGNRAIIAGIALQVVVLLAFGAMSLDYWLRARRWVHSGADVTPAALALWNDKKFRTFGYAVLGAYICVQIRCIYRSVSTVHPVLEAARSIAY